MPKPAHLKIRIVLANNGIDIRDKLWHAADKYGDIIFVRGKYRDSLGDILAVSITLGLGESIGSLPHQAPNLRSYSLQNLHRHVHNRLIGRFKFE